KQVEITNLQNILAESNYYTFAVLDVFVKVVGILSEKHSTESLGQVLEGFCVESYFPQASIFPSSIACQVIYIDDYGNCYLNIDDVTFTKALAGRGFELRVDADCTISRISSSYQDATIIGKALLTVSSTHNLELAIREDNFARLLGYEKGSKVIINIKA
ncbi:MAG: SAM-dependent chlorinase/fluorinase, partial [Bacteroidales bacterium]|nr:SAM-dependent chlorinase/fluorinase [Bacteroidales bacterium]